MHPPSCMPAHQVVGTAQAACLSQGGHGTSLPLPLPRSSPPLHPACPSFPVFFMTSRLGDADSFGWIGLSRLLTPICNHRHHHRTLQRSHPRPRYTRRHLVRPSSQHSTLPQSSKPTNPLVRHDLSYWTIRVEPLHHTYDTDNPSRIRRGPIP